MAPLPPYHWSMSRNAQDVLQEALELPESDRADIVAELLASLGAPAPSSERTDGEWIAEIERRALAALAGAPGVPWKQARASIEESLRGKG